MSTEISFVHLLLEASLLVQLVMAFLLLMSVLAWTLIFQRQRVLKEAKESATRFEDRFWSGVDLNRLYRELSARDERNSGLERMFTSGFQEYARLTQSSRTPDAVVEGSYRAMRVCLSREVDKLEQGLPTLATIGSISPYVGLFGTVWGIMNSFIALGSVQHATLNMVAPGIAEALIATAMGLFAAIPAVMFYNRFSTKVEKLENHYANFMDEFSNILHRQAMNQHNQQQQQPPQHSPHTEAQA